MVVRRNIYKGVYLQRGNGIGSVLSGLFRVLVPFIKTGATSIAGSAPVQRAVKSAKKSAIKVAGNAAGELLSGRNPREKAKIDLKRAQSDIERAFTTPEPLKQKKKKKKKVVTTGRIAPLI